MPESMSCCHVSMDTSVLYIYMISIIIYDDTIKIAIVYLAAEAHVRVGLAHGLELLLRRLRLFQQPHGGTHQLRQLRHVGQERQQLGDSAEAAEGLEVLRERDGDLRLVVGVLVDLGPLLMELGRQALVRMGLDTQALVDREHLRQQIRRGEMQRSTPLTWGFRCPT